VLVFNDVNNLSTIKTTEQNIERLYFRENTWGKQTIIFEALALDYSFILQRWEVSHYNSSHSKWGDIKRLFFNQNIF